MFKFVRVSCPGRYLVRLIDVGDRFCLLECIPILDKKAAAGVEPVDR
jgi:hypothetical protein